jgi:glutamyl-tRNA synthetase
VLALCRERLDTLGGLFDYAAFFFQGELSYEGAALEAMVPAGRTAGDTARLLASLLEQLVDPLPDWSRETLETGLQSFAEASGWAAKDAYMTVRVAVTGRTATPPLFETLAVLGKEVCRLRLRRAADALRAAHPAGAPLPERRP